MWCRSVFNIVSALLNRPVKHKIRIHNPYSNTLNIMTLTFSVYRKLHNIRKFDSRNNIKHRILQ